MKNLLFYFFFLTTISSFSQKIYGIVLDGNTDEPITGASVYFDNTTIGISTNNKGEFTLNYKNQFKTSLVVSFMGYKTYKNPDFLINKEMKIYLYESTNTLAEVVVNTNDGWSKELKKNEFTKHFLGDTQNGRACKILNKQDIILRYNKRAKKLTARAVKPIFIKNPNLEYLISVELTQFEVNYSFVSRNNKRRNVNYVYYSGANFFTSTDKDSSLKTLRKRKKTYEGSVLHFMRALSKNEISKKGYQIYYGHHNVENNRYIKVQKLDNLGVKVKLKDKLSILYKNGKQSSIESLVDEFFIDYFGNHSPASKIIFKGDLGNKRMGDTLPLDFLLTKS